MTNNTDEFDQDQFDTFDPSTEGEKGTTKQGLMEAWRSKPLIKLIVIMIGVSAALALVLGTSTKEKTPVVSVTAKAPGLKEAPGGSATPFFIEQNEQANQLRSDAALVQGGSAMPTPVGHNVSDLLDKSKPDPLKEFREETERLKQELRNEQVQNNEKMRQIQMQVSNQSTQRVVQEDDSLAKAMQKQMQQLMDSWAPRPAKFVAGIEEKAKPDTSMVSGLQQASFQNSSTSSATIAEPKTIVSAGTVNYIQLLTEANSDVPGPILAQILSGPLAGGRAIGRFQVMNEYLVMTFSNVSHKGRDYSISGLALDPDTTLGGMATEVDHRYLKRVLLPAAGAFVSAFGEALADTETTTSATDGALFVDNAKKGYKEAIYSGIGKMGDTMSNFFEQQANQTKTLVRVAVGTPMGLFFLQPVTDQKAQYGRTADDSSEARPLNNEAVPYPNTGKTNMGSAYGLSPQQSEMFNQMMSTISGASQNTRAR